MMNIKTKLLHCIAISPEHWDVPMRVELRPYLEFNRRISCQLRRLVDSQPAHTPQEDFSFPANRRSRGR
jgi:hypothetical protein